MLAVAAVVALVAVTLMHLAIRQDVGPYRRRLDPPARNAQTPESVFDRVRIDGL